MEKRFEIPETTTPINASPIEAPTGALPIIVPERRKYVDWRSEMNPDVPKKPTRRAGDKAGYTDPKKPGGTGEPYGWSLGVNE